MANTPNFNLEKPDYNDFADVQALNRNADKIDAELKRLNDEKASSTNLANLQNEVTSHLEQDMIQHNQFMDGTIKKQIAWGYNQSLGCITAYISEVDN